MSLDEHGLALTIAIDRGSPVPLYFQAARALEAAIETGVLKPGDLLPNEILLAESIGLSRPTMRHAIDQLVKKGLVVRKRGVGTRVTGPEVRRKFELTSLYDDLAAAGKEPRTDVLVLRYPEHLTRPARAMGLPDNADLTYIERLRYADGRPIAVLRNWVAPLAQPLTADELGSDGLYRRLAARGVRPAVAKQRISARLANREEGRLLGVGRNSPLVTMERTAFAEDRSPVEFAEHIYVADSYAIEVTVYDR